MPNKKVIARAMKCSRILKSSIQNSADGCKKHEERFTCVITWISCALMPLCIGRTSSQSAAAELKLSSARTHPWA